MRATQLARMALVAIIATSSTLGALTPPAKALADPIICIGDGTIVNRSNYGRDMWQGGHSMHG
jgi:hypothetical protein